MTSHTSIGLPHLAQLLLGLLITTLHMTGAAALPAAERRDIVVGDGGDVTPDKVTPVDFGAQSATLDLGDGAVLTLNGGDLSVAGSEVLVDGQNLSVK